MKPISPPGLRGMMPRRPLTWLRKADGGASWRAEESGTVLHLTGATYRPDGAALAAGWHGVILSADPPASPLITGLSSPGAGRP